MFIFSIDCSNSVSRLLMCCINILSIILPVLSIACFEQITGLSETGRIQQIILLWFYFYPFNPAYLVIKIFFIDFGPKFRQVQLFWKSLKRKKKIQQNSKIVLPRLIHVFILKCSSNQRKKFCLQFFTEPARWFGLFIEYAMNLHILHSLFSKFITAFKSHRIP